MRTLVSTVVVVALLATPGTAQTAAPAAVPAPAAAGAAVAPIAIPAPRGFNYAAEGRRDPFVSLLQRGSDVSRTDLAARPPGLAGLAVSEVVLKGTLLSKAGYVAILQGVDNKTYIVRAGERLMDGTVRTITQNAMVIQQQVTDSLTNEKQRDVRKLLRQTDEAK